MTTAKKDDNYLIVDGIDVKGKRYEPGDIATDLPLRSVRWLIEAGHIRPVKRGE